MSEQPAEASSSRTDLEEDTSPASTASAGHGRRLSVALTRSSVVLAVVIAAAVVLAYVRADSPVIATQAIVTGLLIGGVYGLVAMGLTLIFGVLDIVNFAHGAFLAVALFVTWWLVSNSGLHPYVTMLVTAPVMFAVGYAVQRGILSGAMGKPLENQLLITFGIALVLENALLLIFGANPQVRFAAGGSRDRDLRRRGGSLEDHRLRRRSRPGRAALPGAAANPARHRDPGSGRQRQGRSARRHRHARHPCPDLRHRHGLRRRCRDARGARSSRSSRAPEPCSTSSPSSSS